MLTPGGLSGALTRTVAIVGLCWIAATAPGGSAEADRPREPWDAARMSDPLEMSRWVARRGDGEVLSRLRPDARPIEQLPGVMGARWMVDPERALPRLAALAAGRDPRVAPAAAVAAFHIASNLDPRDLEAREVPRSHLEEARAALAALVEDETARPDLARLAGFAAEQLRALSSTE